MAKWTRRNLHKDRADKLIKAAIDVAGDLDNEHRYHKIWKDTDLYIALDIISDIAQEIAISVKQHCKKDGFILKKLRRYDVYVLIRPTNSQSHTFYSIFLPRGKGNQVLCQLPFLRMEELSQGWVSPFYSIKKERLGQLCAAPMMMLNLVTFFSWFYEVRDEHKANFPLEGFYMLNLSLLIYLENKPMTEQTITYTRYMYMEMLKGDNPYCKPDPWKMIKKFDTNVRSRLVIWLRKKIIEGFTTMMENKPQKMMELKKGKHLHLKTVGKILSTFTQVQNSLLHPKW